VRIFRSGNVSKQGSWKRQMGLGSRSLLFAAIGSLLCFASARDSVGLAHSVSPARPFDGTLSVLTYNIKGSAWPIAWGRPAAFRAIAGRLRDLRSAGRNPQVVVLQEAFSAEARAIGWASGYRYIVNGPAVDEVDPAPMTNADRTFAAEAHWWLGESAGKAVGSGLQLLSDFPVIRVRRMAFPSFACAGYDCLANKGALLVTVLIPGAPSPVDVVTTHLNSRHSSGVPDARSLHSYRRQAALLASFIRRWHDPLYPLIAAGDFNAGTSSARWAALRAQIDLWPGARSIRNAITQVAARSAATGARMPPDTGEIIHHGTDWQLFTSGRLARLRAIEISVPFGREADGSMLSDHIGYVARFRLLAEPRVATDRRNRNLTVARAGYPPPVRPVTSPVPRGSVLG
jgi:endonuclease/exonuclease/phosphatase family metal-dependent hydrolase